MLNSQIPEYSYVSESLLSKYLIIYENPQYQTKGDLKYCIDSISFLSELVFFTDRPCKKLKILF